MRKIFPSQINYDRQGKDFDFDGATAPHSEKDEDNERH